MYRPLIIASLVFVLVNLALFYFAHQMNLCALEGSDYLSTRYSLTKGCLIETMPGEFLPVEELYK